jgi:hypothetical protein
MQTKRECPICERCLELYGCLWYAGFQSSVKVCPVIIARYRLPHPNGNVEYESVQHPEINDRDDIPKGCLFELEHILLLQKMM